jgi:protein-tyrosine phosphatase
MSSTDLPSFLDVHSHLVPGVDDGVESVDEALTSLVALRSEGVTALVTTPHLLLPYLDSDAAIDRQLSAHRDAFEEVSTAVAERSDLPVIGLGQEIFAPDAATLRRIAHRTDVGLAGTRWLLVEFGFDLQGTHEDVIRAATAAGREIIVAHPVRYRYLDRIEPIELMRRWRGLGALLQVNAGSFSGHYRAHNPGSMRLAWEMVGHGLVDLVSTDHHGTTRRSGVSPREAFEALVARGERALAERAMTGTSIQSVRDALGRGARTAVRSPGADA